MLYLHEFEPYIAEYDLQSASRIGLRIDKAVGNLAQMRLRSDRLGKRVRKRQKCDATWAAIGMLELGLERSLWVDEL